MREFGSGSPLVPGFTLLLSAFLLLRVSSFIQHIGSAVDGRRRNERERRGLLRYFFHLCWEARLCASKQTMKKAIKKTKQSHLAGSVGRACNS